MDVLHNRSRNVLVVLIIVVHIPDVHITRIIIARDTIKTHIIRLMNKTFHMAKEIQLMIKKRKRKLLEKKQI